MDDDFWPTYGEKPTSWKPKSFGHASRTGKRMKRGLYRTEQGWLVNADANGSANIFRKVAATLGFSLNGVSRGELTTPL